MKKLLLLITLVCLTSCSAILNSLRPTYNEVLYHVPFGSDYPSLPQNIDVPIPDGIKSVTVYLGFNVFEGGGAYGSFEVYLDGLLETNKPNYGVNAIHRVGDTKTGTYYAQYVPTVVEDDDHNNILTLACYSIAWHDGAIWKDKIGVKDYGITKVIGHY